ncbi:hypothetical protein M0R45_035706 [Rubus argutus]|uniref:Uncharacterized protein n=1 Tax=Rubus argutus TaxID=59490 RepID=A0AAW1VXP3_RUBAR
MQAFRGAISDCNLEDLRAVGGPFTWCNSLTKERLDRGLASPAWRAAFSFSRVVHLAPSKSDHIPLLLEVRVEPQTLNRRRRLFRFEEIWSSHSSFPQVVDQVWSQPQLGSPMLQLYRRIKDTRSHLLEWDREVFGRRKVELEETRLLLQQLLQKPYDPADQEERVRLSGVGTEFGNDIEFVNEDGKGSSAINGANQQSQSTFAGLSDVKGKKNKKQVRQSTVPKKNRKKPKATRYNTRKKGNKKYKAVENSDDSDEGSDFYVDSDYDLQQDDDDYSQFEENVANPRVVEEFNDMGFRGKCSDDGGDL